MPRLRNEALGETSEHLVVQLLTRSRNHIEWCSSEDNDQPDLWEEVTSAQEESVLAALTHEYQSYEELADALDLIPWEALQACKQLVRKGSAEKKFWKGEFRLRE